MISVNEAREISESNLKKRTPKLYKTINREIKSAGKIGLFVAVVCIEDFLKSDVMTAIDQLCAMGYNCEKRGDFLLINWDPEYNFF